MVSVVRQMGKMKTVMQVLGGRAEVEVGEHARIG